MCNTYRAPEPRAETLAAEVESRVARALRLLKNPLIRRTDAGVVLPCGEAQGRLMRWGVPLRVNPAVNNARVEKLDEPVWRESWRWRRCAIPAAEFYEWGQGERRGAHRIRRPGSDAWLWIAGLWQPSEEHGDCFAMVTTPANEAMRTLHHRMPALIAEGELDSFLSGADWRPRPASEALDIEACASPLKRAVPDQQPEQGELF